ncbi:diguanylate cyclase (GGDEF) domain-containing protein [Alkalibacterium subtropicum]|uniref:Diguanylate cyclase (GGDEF) domain-containing protein n=1 Tax=Alkalibacterium subtropicum TaxID=753702 RepID=A0A1I1I980_9LACT|nr:response regulator [Alkalibacterium subtropicum]SFC32999.1 diguanylate cyclase (GGDEF) domain-containing protein [Alkalibacterium subtropicum]
MNQEKLKEIIKKSQRKFLIEKNEQMTHISRNLISFLSNESDEDYEALYQFYHRVKGTAGTLELDGISSAAEEVETLLLNEKDRLASHPDYFSALIKGTGSLLFRIEQQLSEVLISAGDVTVPEGSKKHTKSSGTILVVDDDVSMLAFLEDLLKDQGYEVLVTHSGNDALEYMKNEKIDLALIDIVMPEKSGFDIYEEIVQMKTDTTIIFLTGLNIKEVRYEALRTGAETIYQKPVDPNELLAHINGTFKKRQITKQQQNLDELTGVFTRKHFVHRFEQEKERFIRNGDVFSVAFTDLDHFKAINDTHGHLYGDRVLIEFVKTIKRNMDDKCEVFRFGGDEFLILLPQTSGVEAKTVIDDIRLDLLSNVFYTSDDKVDLTLSFSSGIAEFKNKSQTKTTLLEAADKALYIAKEKGKNRVILQSETLRVAKNKILVVDDEQLLTNIIKTRLGYLGYDVDYAKDGQEALDRLSQRAYDLVLLDIMLPKVTGIEVLKKIKGVSLNAEPKIIMISGKHSEASVMESLKLGADDFFEKPFSLDVLEHKIKKILTT